MSLELHEHELETPLDDGETPLEDGAGESESGEFSLSLLSLDRNDARRMRADEKVGSNRQVPTDPCPPQAFHRSQGPSSHASFPPCPSPHPSSSQILTLVQASICEPIGNLESWMYAERPDFFAAMATGDDELERMLAVLRWTCEDES